MKIKLDVRRSCSENKEKGFVSREGLTSIVFSTTNYKNRWFDSNFNQKKNVQNSSSTLSALHRFSSTRRGFSGRKRTSSNDGRRSVSNFKIFPRTLPRKIRFFIKNLLEIRRLAEVERQQKINVEILRKKRILFEQKVFHRRQIKFRFVFVR